MAGTRPNICSQVRNSNLSTCWSTTITSSHQGRFPDPSWGWKVPMPWNFISAQLDSCGSGRARWDDWCLNKEVVTCGPRGGGETDQFNIHHWWELSFPWYEQTLGSWNPDDSAMWVTYKGGQSIGSSTWCMAWGCCLCNCSTVSDTNFQ